MSGHRTGDLADDLRATLRTRFDDAPAAPVGLERVHRRVVRRRRRRTAAAGSGVLAVAAVVATFVVPGTAPTGVDIADRPDGATSDPLDAARGPSHALVTTPAGGLVAVDLDSGTRTDLVAAAPSGSRSPDLRDLETSADATPDDFTAVAYDDGAGPLGFVTYVRRDGGPVATSFTPKEQLGRVHSNRGLRTISPDGRWLAYSTGGVTLAPIDPVTAEVDTDAQVDLDLPGAVGWVGDVTDVGDRSVLVHPVGDEQASATVLERTEDGFDPVDELVLGDLVAPGSTTDGRPFRRLQLGTSPGGAPGDVRFDLVVDERAVEVGQLVRPDHLRVAYAGPEGDAEVRFETAGSVGNPDLTVRGRTALVVDDAGPFPSTTDQARGVAWLVRAVPDPDGQEVRLEVSGPIVEGVVDGALLWPSSTAGVTAAPDPGAEGPGRRDLTDEPEAPSGGAPWASSEDAEPWSAPGDPDHAVLALTDGSVVVSALAGDDRVLTLEGPSGSGVDRLVVTPGSDLDDFLVAVVRIGSSANGSSVAVHRREGGGEVTSATTRHDELPGAWLDALDVAVSPDGAWLAYLGDGPGGAGTWLHVVRVGADGRFGTDTAQPLTAVPDLVELRDWYRHADGTERLELADVDGAVSEVTIGVDGDAVTATPPVPSRRTSDASSWTSDGAGGAYDVSIDPSTVLPGTSPDTVVAEVTYRPGSGLPVGQTIASPELAAGRLDVTARGGTAMIADGTGSVHLASLRLHGRLESEVGGHLEPVLGLRIDPFAVDVQRAALLGGLGSGDG